jgi:hypothetical protein
MMELPPSMTPNQARGAEVLMKMKLQEDTLAQKRFLVRSLIVFFAVMMAATLYAAFYRQDVKITAIFALVDGSIGWSYRSVHSHFFPSSTTAALPEASKSA